MTEKLARQKILDAFRLLVLREPYDDITVTGIVSQANIGRSTFYEHFPDKRAVLISSLAHILDTLCACATNDASEADVRRMVNHLSEHRDVGRILLNLPESRHISSALAEMLGNKSDLTRLHCYGIASSQLGVIRSWLSDELRASEREITDWLLTH